MAKSRKSATVRLQVEQLEEREVPAVVAWQIETFDQLTPPAIPAGWIQWSSTGSSVFGTSTAKAFSAGNGLASNAGSSVSGRTWKNDAVPANQGVQATILADSLIPVQLFARGSDLATATPDYYAVSVTRGLQVDLLRVVNGVSTTLATVKSKDYVSNKWVRVGLSFSGNQLNVQVFRTDTSLFLDAQGNWGATAVNALQATDTAITTGGQIGINRPALYSGAATIDDFTVIAPTGGTSVSETFNSTTVNGVPAGWSRWSSDGALGFGASPARAIDGLGLTSVGTSTRASRTWASEVLPADLQASASIYVDSLIPGQIFVRGSGLNSPTPTYYALSIGRGLNVSMVRVVNGVTTTLASLTSSVYTSGLWVQASLSASGSHLQARVQRLDDGRWLNKFGVWQEDATAALDLFDNAIAGDGQVGLSRPALYSGNISFDNFQAHAETDDITAPSVQFTLPNGGQNLSGIVSIPVSVSDASGIQRVERLVDGLVVDVVTASPWTWNLDTRIFTNGAHILTVRAHDLAGNLGEVSQTATFINAASFTLPTIPRHYSHIRVAELAYSGNPMGAFEKTLLQTSIDVVVPNLTYLSTINQTAPNTPLLVYSNVSNLYEGLLTDWLNYADAHGVARELAFYHVTQATAYTGASASSLPVDWLWNVEVGPLSGTTGFTKQTAESRNSTAGDVDFGVAGQALYLGYTDRYRELNINLSRGKQSGWSGVLEYVSSVDAAGNPTAWKTLPLVSDATSGFTRSGRINFDPPSDWKPALVPGSTARLFYVRVRTTAGTAAQSPIATTILGRDFVNAAGAAAGTIPAFDYAADKNGDGYLSDTEYNTRASGKNARFAYEGRLFYPYYGSMRFITDPANSAVHDWAANYHQRFMIANPLADGIFMDNSSGKNPIPDSKVIETTASYASDYSAMLAAINRAIAPRWVMANTSSGSADTVQIVRVVPATMEEFALRAMNSTWQQFNDLAAIVAQRQAALSPSGYMVLDSLSTGGSMTNARTQIATLAEYYLLGNPNSTMFMPFGGEEPASSWTRHWFNAIAYNVGQPLSPYSIFVSGADPANTALTYNIYGRQYQNALVLYKPLSYKLGKGTGTIADNTATTHQLGGTYRILNADGTLSGPVTSVTLRNGEGAILIK